MAGGDFLTGLNTGALGAVRGVALADEMLGRRDDLALRQKQSERADRLMAIQETQEGRAAAMGDITRQQQQLTLDKQRQEQQWQQEEQQHWKTFNTDKDGKPVDLTEAREMEFGRQRFARDLSRGRVSTDDLMKMGEYQKKMKEEGVFDSFKKLIGGDQEGARKFLDAYSLQSGAIARDQEHGGYELTGVTKDGKKVSVPLGFIGIANSKDLSTAIEKMSATDLAQQKVKFYTGASQDAKLAASLDKEMGQLYSQQERSVLREHEELQKKLSDPLLSAADKADVQDRLTKVRSRADNLVTERGAVSSILDNAHENGVKLRAENAQRILREAAQGKNLEVRNGDIYYTGGTKAIRMPPNTVPADIAQKLLGSSGGGTAPAAAIQDMGPPAPPRAAPAQAAALQGAPAAPAAPTSPAERSGQVVDKLKVDLARAKAAEQGFGVVQQKRDPQGLARARAERQRLERELAAAQSEYERQATPSAMPLRVK